MTLQFKMIPQPELVGDIWHWQNTAWTDEVYIQTTQKTPHDYCPHGSPDHVRVDQEDGIWYWLIDADEERSE